jgi:hypothetical protein
MCAVGAFGNKKFSVLLMDTDEENKDKRNAESLIDSYMKLRESMTSGSTQNGNSSEFDSRSSLPYFTSEIELFTFVPDYSTYETRNFVSLSDLERDNSGLSRRLANIFYEEGVQEFDLAHGYRAQTHLGSYLMYHALVDEVRQSQQNSTKQSSSELYKFIKRVADSNSTGGRLFTFGSSFGGTGASSIPVMPRAISDCASIVMDNTVEINNIFFGGVVLSAYFKFSPPAADQKKKEKVIANSQFFSHNSAAALDYYVKDTTILEKYKSLYLLGWPSSKMIDVDEFKEKYMAERADGETVTGGKKQENPAHLLEVMSVSAAYHFMHESLTIENDLKKQSKTKFYYKSLDTSSDSDLIVEEDDIIPNFGTQEQKDSEVFLHSLMSFYSLGVLLQERFENDLSALTNDFKLYNNAFHLNDEAVENLTYFLNYFSMKGSKKEGFKPGWLQQIYTSFTEANNGGKTFLRIPDDAFNSGNDAWAKAYEQLSLKDPADEFMKRFKQLNKNSGGDLKAFLNATKQTFESFDLNQTTSTE